MTFQKPRLIGGSFVGIAYSKLDSRSFLLSKTFDLRLILKPLYSKNNVQVPEIGCCSREGAIQIVPEHFSIRVGIYNGRKINVAGLAITSMHQRHQDAAFQHKRRF
ncbi:hypothetical protein KL86PLE_90421 [uncultured Pleomorphomonas sp.]|uniref:Uncharacterized protein n=1 Tax=uncultured Pleomorphomonas sp. TaxID=442121 RepID=A0A212LPI9_9HYPH|nr:hypothetical protein KL86PLE_90421 [uncultured Pleomorphomonas sp.]